MSKYDFNSALSHLDFELLSKDLLERELNVSLENFAEGRDAGIDLRYAPLKGKYSSIFIKSKPQSNPKLIVQCKRYSNFSNLKSELKNNEFSKIKKLNPERYILVTSVSLSQQQVTELEKILSPYVLSTGDIWGRERLNSLLVKYPEIERRHVKLWLDSAGVLDSILHAGTHIISREEIEKTMAAAKIYVRNPSFDEALAILKEHKVCIISGIPGIGKTTLARMLLIYFYDLEYDIVKITSDVSEAVNVGYHKKPRFYYYDDFLGQTGQPDKLNKNEDQRLLDFMSAVKNSKNSIFVLTTREYILNQAKIHYEKIDRARFDHTTCVVDLSKYSRKIKAEILYNHLHFSNLEKEFLLMLVKSRGYIKIVDHLNYNPRLIEYLTDQAWVGQIDPTEYFGFFISKLDNPIEIWGHAFRNQIAERSRNLLLVLTSMPAPSTLLDLEKAFDSFHHEMCSNLGIPRANLDFKSALKELDGTFVSIDRVDEARLVQFHNPSIRDFMHNILFDGGNLLKLISCLVFFEQGYWFVKILQDVKSKIPKSELKTLAPKILTSLINTSTSKGCAISVVGGGSNRWIQDRSLNYAERLSVILKVYKLVRENVTELWVANSINQLIKLMKNKKIQVKDVLVTMQDFSKSGFSYLKEWKESLKLVKRCTLDNSQSLQKYEDIKSAQCCFPKLYSLSEMENVAQEFQDFIDDYDDFSEFQSPEDFRDAASSFADIGASLKVSTAGIEELLEEKAEESEAEENSDWDDNDDDRAVSHLPEVCSDSDLDSMFGTLK